MNKEKSIDVMNGLIEINNDRIEGYETATKETEEQDLKVFFAELTGTSQYCKQELVTEIMKSGGNPIKGTKTTTKFLRIWIAAKAALSGKDRKAILCSCDYGEDMAVDTYEKALENVLGDITPGQQTMIKAQYALIKADHDKVKSMRDLLAA